MPVAIISVYDKTGLDYVGKLLVAQNFEIYATEGTLNYLNMHGIKAEPVKKLMNNPVGFEDMFSSVSFTTVVGALSENDDQIIMCGSKRINLIIYNFVPTWEVIHGLNDFNIHNVDFGGPTMVRAAAINYKNVVIIINPSQYQLLSSFDSLSQKDKRELAKQAFEYTSSYDKELANYIGGRIHDKEN